jgi:hypothetical protein
VAADGARPPAVLLATEDEALAELYGAALGGRYELVRHDARPPAQPFAAVLLDPSSACGIEAVLAARSRRPRLGIVAACVYPCPPHVLDALPGTRVVTPFSLARVDVELAALVAAPEPNTAARRFTPRSYREAPGAPTRPGESASRTGDGPTAPQPKGASPA